GVSTTTSTTMSTATTTKPPPRARVRVCVCPTARPRVRVLVRLPPRPRGENGWAAAAATRHVPARTARQHPHYRPPAGRRQGRGGVRDIAASKNLSGAFRITRLMTQLTVGVRASVGGPLAWRAAVLTPARCRLAAA